MKTKWIVVGGAAVLAGLVVLATVRARTQPGNPSARIPVFSAKEEPAQANLPVVAADLISIVHLETQDKFVTIQSGAEGLVYQVQAKDGTLLHENLSEEQLKAQAPEMHDLIKTAVAGGDSKDNSFLDARVGR